MFADDTVLISSYQDPVIANSKLSNDLNILYGYFGRLCLKLNPNKTKVMNFGRNWRGNDSSKFPVLFLNRQEIESVSSFKYLGVTIDVNLNFIKHLETCFRNANGKLYMLNKIRGHMSNETALLLFKTMVLPYLENGNIFMLNCCEGDVARIQKLQNKALKLLLRKDRLYNTVMLHKDARLANWKARALTASMRLMFKFKYYLNENVDHMNTTSEVRSQLGLVWDLLLILRDRIVIDF